MNSRKNQNSLLVLATLGVYLGLVLTGATPQVLAQAAMTRQFDVKDEIEVKDNLDKKPENLIADATNETVSAVDRKISSSLERFLSKFKTINPVSALCTATESRFDEEHLQWQIKSNFERDRFYNRVSINKIVAVTNFPRAGLDSLLATDAK